MDKETLLGKNTNELQQITDSFGMPRYAAGQIAAWLYRKHVASIMDMTDIPVSVRVLLNEQYCTGLSPPLDSMTSSDGTVKYLFDGVHGRQVEAVWLPGETRGTLCLSTQCGCKMACIFCMTGRQGFGGSLAPSKILNQYASNPFRKSITNIVYMGMGEPLDTIDATLRSLEVFTSSWGYAMSPGRITVSTVGLLPGLKRFVAESRCHLAVSLHSPFDEERKRLMPVESAWPVKGIIDFLAQHDWSGQRRLSFEYIMWDGVNDSKDHARQLIRLLSHLKCRVNLLHYHSLPDSSLKGSQQHVMENFQNMLKDKGIMATIRKSRGEDILAACGLLSTQEEKQNEDGIQY